MGGAAVTAEAAATLDETRRVCLVALAKFVIGESWGEAMGTAVHALYFHHNLIAKDDAEHCLLTDDLTDERFRVTLMRAVNRISGELGQPELFDLDSPEGDG